LAVENPPDPKKIWDERYLRLSKGNARPKSQDWLSRWRYLLDTSGNNPILDIGCGIGLDSEYLTDQGYKVIALDYSLAALKLTCRAVEKARLAQVDIRKNFPFRDSAFQIIISNLCLHYFNWNKTLAIVEEIHRILKPGGYLVARFNSIKDMHYGAVGHAEIEPDYYSVFGMGKRFFDRANLEELFKNQWEFLSLEESTIQRYEKPKVVWEIVLKRL